MADFTPSISGQDNLAGDERALLLELFSNEVRQVYFSETIMKNKVRVHALSGGKSFRFPVVGRAAASYHTRGTQLTGQLIAHSEQKIEVDAKLIADVTLDTLDDKLNHFDVRKYYSEALGQSLARAFDLNSMRSIGIAARATHPITGEPGGTTISGIVLTDADSAVNAKTLYEAIKQASFELIKKDRDPKKYETWCVITPDKYSLLLEHLDLLNRDYAGSGSLLTADVPMIANINIMHSNLFEEGVLVDGTSEANYGTKYSIDFTNTIGLVWNIEAVGNVQAMDVSMSVSWHDEYDAWLMIAKQAHGWGTLIPSNAVELSIAP